MKKVIVGLLFSVLLLTSCSNANTGETRGGGTLVDIGDLGKGYDLFRDTKTGCVYIREGSGHSLPLTAYYGEDGKVVGCGDKKLDKSQYN